MTLFPNQPTSFEHTFQGKVTFLSNVVVKGTLSTSNQTTSSGTDGNDSSGSAGGVTANNLAGGVQGSIPYQSDTNVTGFLAPGTSGYFLKTNGPGANPEWAEVATPVEAIPSGSTMLFYQASAPTGWTKQTTHNDKSLRVVSGTGGGSGGSTAFTSVFGSRTPTGSVSASSNGAQANISVNSNSISISVNSHTLTQSEMPSHNHEFQNGFFAENNGNRFSGVQGSNNGNDNDNRAFTRGDNTNNAGSTNSHSHGLSQSSHNHGLSQSDHSHGISASFSGNAMDFAVQYVDVIICSRN